MTKKSFPSIKKNLPYFYRILGKFMPESFWAKKAEKSEKNEDFGSAYYEWIASASFSRNSDNTDVYNNNANNCLKNWRKNNFN